MAKLSCRSCPIRTQVISIFTPVPASAEAISAFRQSIASGIAIIPARNTPRMARTLSTVLGN
jgi:hypothetical protein